MAILKQIKFGPGASTPIAKTVVKGKGVIAVTNTDGRKNDGTEELDYSYDIDVNVDGSTIVTTGDKLAVGIVPAAKVSVEEGTGLKATDAQVAFKELKDKIDEVGGAAKSYTIVKKTEGVPTTVKEQYLLQDEKNTPVGEPINIYKDSSLKEVKLQDQQLMFTYILADGSESTVGVDVSTFLAESEFKNGLEVNNEDGTVSVKVDTDSEGFLTVGANGVKLSGVQNAINAAKAAATTKVVEGTDAGNNLTVVPTTSEADGSTTYTINLTDVASKAALDAEIAARKAVDGQNGDAYAANNGTNYISNATSLNDADIKLDAALKEEAGRAKAAEAAEVTRAQKAEKEIADKVGLGGVEGSRTFNPTTNYGTGTATVKDNMQAIDSALKSVDDRLTVAEGKVAGIQYHVDGTTLEFFGMTDKAGAGA